MCESTDASRGAGAAIPRPRWGVLYGVVSLGLVALAIADVAAPTVARSTFDSVLAGGALAAIALWVHRSRTALDLQDWCECAADKTSVRVIPSRCPEQDAPTCPDVTVCVPAEEPEDVWAVGSPR
jgi:hypothetical protein